MKKRCKILFHDGTEQIVDADDWQRIEDQIQCFRGGQSVAVFDKNAVKGVVVEDYDPDAWSKFVRRMQVPVPYGTDLED
jgi:hypothetical protein